MTFSNDKIHFIFYVNFWVARKILEGGIEALDLLQISFSTSKSHSTKWQKIYGVFYLMFLCLVGCHWRLLYSIWVNRFLSIIQHKYTYMIMHHTWWCFLRDIRTVHYGTSRNVHYLAYVDQMKYFPFAVAIFDFKMQFFCNETVYEYLLYSTLHHIAFIFIITSQI